MPSSLFELTNQLGVTSDPPQQVDASGGTGARSIILTFPGLPSCCTEITISFEDDNRSDTKWTQSEKADIRLPTHELSTKTREELAKSGQFKTCEDGLGHEFDQSTVYIGLDSGLTAGRKKARKKTESLVRTLPILSHCTKRWLNFRGRKGHERGRICAFESGDVGKITSSSTSVDDGSDSPRQKLDATPGCVSSRTPLTFLNSMATFSTSSSHDRKKSLERSHDTRAVKYSSRKSKSGVGISETKPETVHGEEVEAGSTKQKSDPSMNQLKVNNLPQPTRSKHNPQVEFDLSDSHEKVEKHGAGRCSETNKDRCKVPEAKDADMLPYGGPQLSSKPSGFPKSMPSQSSSKMVSKTTGHKALDTMFVDVIKMLVAQEDVQNTKRSPSLGEQQENHTLQTNPCGKSTRQQVNECHAFGNNRNRRSDQSNMRETRKPQENVVDGSVSRNELPSCDFSRLNCPLRTHSYHINGTCGRNISCDRSISYDKIRRWERNISCDRNMGYDNNQDCARNVSCDRNMIYDKNKDYIRNITFERNRNFDSNISCGKYISSDGNIGCDRNISCAGNINCDKEISRGRKIICHRNISCERTCRLQHETTRSNSNNCHLCCWGEVSECKDFLTVLDSASSSDDSLRGSFGSNEDLLSSEERKLEPHEGESRSSKVREKGSSLQGRLRNAVDEKQTGGKSRSSDQYREKLAAPVLAGSPEVDHSSSEENLCGLQQRSGTSHWDDPKDDLSKSVAAKAEVNAGSFQNGKYVFLSENYCTRKDKDESTCFHISIHKGIDKALCDNNNVDSTTCTHNCSSASLCRQCNECRQMTKEREDGNESQGYVAKENGAHKSVPKYEVVAVKSSKLHKIFSKSSENTRCTEERPPDCDLENKNPGNVHLTSGTLDDEMSSTSVNLDSEDDQSRLVEQEKPEEDCCSVDLQAAGGLNAKVTPLLGRFISLEKHKSRLSLASSFFGKAKIALSCVRSRSSSPAALGKKIKKMFFKESVDRILSKNPTVILNTGKDKRQGSGSNQEKSSRQDVVSKQMVVSKKRVDLRLVAGSKKNADISVIPKDVCSPCCSTDVHGSIVKKFCKPQIKTTQTLQLEEEDKVEQAFSHIEASTSRSDEAEPVRSQSPTDLTSVRIHSARACPDSASFVNRTTSDKDLDVDLRRKITQYLDCQFKMAPHNLPASAPFTVIIPPSLEAIAEAESPSEESKADEEMTQIKCEMFSGRDNIKKVIISKGTTLECDNGLCAVSNTTVRSKQTCGRKLDLRISSSYEDCTGEFGDVSQGNNEIMPAPVRTHSLLSTFEAAQTELQALNDMAIISREVQMKRYPSFPNLTDINDAGFYVSSVNICGSNDCLVSKNTSGENPHLVQKLDEIRPTDSCSLCSCSTSKTSIGPSIQKAIQSELLPNLVIDGKINAEPHPSSHNFKLPSSETEINTACTQSWMDLENCADALSFSSCLTTATKVNNATHKNSTHDKKLSEKHADLLSWKPQTDKAVDALVNLLPSPTTDRIEESVNDSKFENCQLKTVPTTSKLSDGVDNSGERIQLLRAAVYQEETLVDASVSIMKDVNNAAFQKEGRHSLKENEQNCLTKLYYYLPYKGKQLLMEREEKSSTNVPNCFPSKVEQLVHDKEHNFVTKMCNYFPCNPKLLNSQDCDKSSRSYPKLEGHLDDGDVFRTTTDENTRNMYILDEYKKAADTIKEACEKVCRDCPRLSHSDATKECFREDTVNRDNRFTSWDSSNVADGLFTVATYKFLTAACDQCSINTKLQLPTSTTGQLYVNTENQLLIDTTNQLLASTADQLPTNITNQVCRINPLPTNATNHLSTDAANTLRPNTTNQIFTSTKYEASTTNATNEYARNTTNQVCTNPANVSTTNATNQLFTNATNQLFTNATNQLSTNATNQLSTNATNQRSTNATNQLFTNATNQLFTNATNQLSTNATNQLSTNATNQLSTNATNQLSTNATIQLSTNATNQLSTNATNQLSTNAKQQLSTNATNQTFSSTTNQIFTNTTSQFSKNATNEHLTNTRNELSTDATSQLSAKTTIQLPTNTINPDVQKYHQKQFYIFTSFAHSESYDTPSSDREDPKSIHSSVTDRDTNITFREDHEGMVFTSLDYTNDAHPANSTHLQKQFLLDTNNLSSAESVATCVPDEEGISSVGRDITTTGSCIKTDGAGKESSSIAEVEEESTGRAEVVLDTCNSCLSDMDPEDKSPENNKSSLDEQTPKNDPAYSITHTANNRKTMKTNSQKYAQTATNSKSVPIKLETLLLANTKKSKPSGLNSTTDFTKRDFKGKKERSKNMNNADNGLFNVGDETIDVDLTGFRSSWGSKQFVVASASSIFGAPDKKAASGLRMINSPTKRSFVANHILKPEPEETDDEDSDTLTNAELDQTQDSKIQGRNKVDSKRGLGAFENEIPKTDSQIQTGKISGTIRINETDVRTQSFLNCVLHSASPFASLGHSRLERTLCPVNVLGKAPQMNLGNSSHQNIDMPKPILMKTTSCYDCAFQKTSGTFPAQNFISRTMSKKLAHRTHTWSSRTAATKEDFTSRAQYHLQRCDEELQRSTGVIRRSQEMSVRVHRQMEHTAEKLKLLKWADSRRPQ